MRHGADQDCQKLATGRLVRGSGEGQLLSTHGLEPRARRPIAKGNGELQRTETGRRRRNEVLFNGGCQLHRIRFALMLPDELASGIDEIGRGLLADGKHVRPAALIILGELHRHAALAA